MKGVMKIMNKISIVGTGSVGSTIAYTLTVMGIASEIVMIDINNEKKVLGILENIDNQGKDMKNFVDQYMTFVLDLIKYSLFKDMSVTKLPISLEDKVKYAISFEGNVPTFNKIIDKLLNLKNQIRYDSNQSLSVKVTFIQIIKGN